MIKWWSSLFQEAESQGTASASAAQPSERPKIELGNDGKIIVGINQSNLPGNRGIILCTLMILRPVLTLWMENQTFIMTQAGGLQEK